MPPETAVTDIAAQAGALDHERLTSLINSMADAVIAVDTDIKVVLYNGAALNILDINNIDIGSPLADMLQPFNKDNQLQDIVGLVRAATTPYSSRDLRLRYADGSFSNLYLSIAPVHLGYGQEGQGGHVLLLRDITREKSLEEERDEFISVVSHELRTPITIAEGNLSNAKLMAERNNPEGIMQALKEAHSQVIFLADMINDLSTLSRAERGKLQLAVETIDVPQLIHELVDAYQSEAQTKGLSIVAEISPEVQQLKSSRLYVREVLQNFLTNAIKYSNEGQVVVRVLPDPKGIKFAVQDSGIGISKADQERVFDKFFRADGVRTRRANGTGLGLYITMKLTRLLHAEIELESELNVGSTFTIFIPNLE